MTDLLKARATVQKGSPESTTPTTVCQDNRSQTTDPNDALLQACGYVSVSRTKNQGTGTGAGFANLPASIGTFGCTFFNVTVALLLVQVFTQRNGLRTPATSR